MKFKLFRKHAKKEAKKKKKVQQALSNQSTGFHDAIVPDRIQKIKHKEHPGGFINNGSPAANFLKRFTKQGTSGVGQGNTGHFAHTTLDMLGYKSLTDDNRGNNFLVLSNEYHETIGYAQILRIGGASLSDLPENIIKLILSRFINFLRAYLGDIEFVSLPLPNDSHRQQRSWRVVLDKVNSKLLHDDKLPLRKRKQLFARRAIIKEALNQFHTIDLNLINQGFVMIIFDKTEKKLIRDTDMAFQFGEAALKLSKMSVHEKEVFLYRLNNPNIET